MSPKKKKKTDYKIFNHCRTSLWAKKTVLTVKRVTMILFPISPKHYKKNKQLRRAYCGGCKNCRYMSPIAAGFSPAAIHEIYCGVFCDRRYRQGFCGVLQRQDKKPLQQTCYSGGNRAIAALQKRRRYRQGFLRRPIAAGHKTTAIGILFAAGWTATIDL